MSRFFLSEPARRDLHEIVQYIARDSSAAARRVLAELRTAIRDIAQMLGKGHARKDLTARPFLFWRVGAYLIVRDPKSHPITVVRVLHGARDIPALLGEKHPPGECV